MRWWMVLGMSAACSQAADPTDDTDTDGADGVPVVGLYETTAQSESTACGTLEDVALPIPYQRVVSLGEGTVEVHRCRAVDDCDDFSVDGYVYGPEGQKYKALLTWSTPNETDGQFSCTLNARRETLEARPNEKLRIDGEATLTAIEGAAGQSDEACLEELDGWEPDWSGDLLNCARWEGRLVEE